MLNKLLGFPEDVEDIRTLPYSVKSLIDTLSDKRAHRLDHLIDESILNPLSKSCAPFRESKAIKKQRQKQALNQLEDWHGFKRRTLTAEEEDEANLLSMRRGLDPRNLIKNPDYINKEYVQYGTMVADPLDGRKNKIRKRTKGNLTDQFKEIDKDIGFTKRKFREIQSEKMSGSRNRKWLKLKKTRMFKKTLKDEVRDFQIN